MSMSLNLNLLILLFVTLLPLSTASDPSKNHDTISHVFENHGVVLKPHGFITFSSRNMVSIYRKVPVPTIRIPACENDVEINFTTQIHKLTTKYVELFEAIARPKNYTRRATRQTRSILAFGIGLGLADLVLGGLSYGSLKSHINSLNHQFGEFVKTQHEFDKAVLDFDENIVTLVEATNKEISQQLADINCQILSIIAYNYEHKWENTLKSLLKPLIHGKLKSKLTPEILTPDTLRKILDDHPMLRNTYFSINVYNFYQVASITVVQAQYEHDNVQQSALPDCPPGIRIPVSTKTAHAPDVPHSAGGNC